MPAAPQGIQFLGIVYGILFTIVGAILWRKGIFSTRLKYMFLIVTTLLGFAILSPMLPLMFQELAANPAARAGAAIGMALIGMSIFYVLALLFGRHFCGYLCPIGAVQEIAYLAPVPKAVISNKRALLLLRGVIFLLIIGLGVILSFSLLGLFGIRQFFTLEVTGGLLVFAILVAISLFLYRPFCRIACPTGAIFYIFAAFARWKIRRTSACIECRKCERACPVSEAGKEDMKGECYLCRRCIDACPTQGALVYGSTNAAMVETRG